MQAEISPRHAAALEFAAAGIPVFPCIPGGKRPALDGGFKNASTDPKIINEWFAEADYNIAFEPEKAGFAVIDLDPKNGGPAAWDALPGDKPRTHSVRTPSETSRAGQSPGPGHQG